jgi:predicted enzyme related to lactoylglutathione lyase
MPTLTQHAPGTFCWPELYTADAKAAKAFYTALFGWQLKELPIDDKGAIYTIFTLDGHDVAALNDMMPVGGAQGIPPHWMPYVSTDSADTTAAKTKAGGGTVHKEPFDVMGIGRMAVLQDPTGATFCCWEAKGHWGVGVLDEPGALTWTELMTSDPAKAGPFYTQLFGWGTQVVPMGPAGDYTVFKRGEANAGGMMKTPPEAGNVPPNWTSYFMVTDPDATVAKAQELGAHVIVPPTDIPGIGRFAMLADPTGAAFAVIRYAS